MYNFNTHWTVKDRISFLQRVILIHSYLYYEKDNPVWSDKKYDEISKQLCMLQKTKTEYWILKQTQYGYAFHDFDGTTGFDLWSRLKQKDKQMIAGIAERMGK